MQENQPITNYNSNNMFSFNKEDAVLSNSTNTSDKSGLFKHYDAARYYNSNNITEPFYWTYQPYIASKDPSLSFFEINPHKANMRGIGGYILDFGTSFSWLRMDGTKGELICSTIGSKRTKPDGSIIEINDKYVLQHTMYNVYLNKDNTTVPNKIIQDPSLDIFAIRNKDKDKKIRTCAKCISEGQHIDETPDPFNKYGSSCTPNYRIVFLVTDIAVFDQDSESWLENGQEEIKWLSIPEANIKVVEGAKDNPTKYVLQKPFIVHFNFSAFHGRKSIGTGPYNVEVNPKPYVPYNSMCLKEYIEYLQSPSNFGDTCVVNKLTNKNSYPAYTQIFSSKLKESEGKVTSIPLFYHDKDYINGTGLSHLEMLNIGFCIAEEMKNKDGSQPELENIPIISRGNTTVSPNTKLQAAKQSLSTNIPSITPSDPTHHPQPSESTTYSIKSSIQNAFSKPPSSAKLDNIGDNKADSNPF